MVVTGATAVVVVDPVVVVVALAVVVVVALAVVDVVAGLAVVDVVAPGAVVVVTAAPSTVKPTDGWPFVPSARTVAPPEDALAGTKTVPAMTPSLPALAVPISVSVPPWLKTMRIPVSRSLGGVSWPAGAGSGHERNQLLPPMLKLPPGGAVSGFTEKVGAGHVAACAPGANKPIAAAPPAKATDRLAKTRLIKRVRMAGQRVNRTGATAWSLPVRGRRARPRRA